MIRRKQALLNLGLLGIIGFLFILFSRVASASAWLNNPALDWSILSAGGQTSELKITSEAFVVEDSLGQPIVGIATNNLSGSRVQLSAGFWVSGLEDPATQPFCLFLPITHK